ncbi:hypothetical protein D3C86_2026710 [compost metagenome]
MRGSTSASGIAAASARDSSCSFSEPHGSCTRNPRAASDWPTAIQWACGHFLISAEVAWNSIARGTPSVFSGVAGAGMRSALVSAAG